MRVRSCPMCEKPVAPAAENPSFPMCSERCRMLDLGRWVAGEYRVPGPPVPEEALPAGDDDETLH